MTFCPELAGQGGYLHYRDRLLEAVRTHCVDRTSKFTRTIEDEDLAIGLYVGRRPRRSASAGHRGDTGPSAPVTC